VNTRFHMSFPSRLRRPLVRQPPGLMVLMLPTVLWLGIESARWPSSRAMAPFRHTASATGQ
jgi:hypothetical protein